MRADSSELDELSRLLGNNGIAAFCPTTLTVSSDKLKGALDRIGAWISNKKPDTASAVPLGIHLEGPFISARAAGAHPPSSIRPFSMGELLEFWEASRRKLKILTVAADEFPKAELNKLTQWALKNGVTLSLGHTQASETEAHRVFEQGITHVTHAWNALRFHHRDPGVLGAAMGRPDVFLELILDQIHVSPALMRWTCALHGINRVCFVSDCAPAAGTRNKEVSFGPLSIHLDEGAARLPDGSLAGGGTLLGHAFENWINAETRRSGESAQALLKKYLPALTSAPLKSLNLPTSLSSRHKLRWKCTSKRIELLGRSPR